MFIHVEVNWQDFRGDVGEDIASIESRFKSGFWPNKVEIYNYKKFSCLLSSWCEVALEFDLWTDAVQNAAYELLNRWSRTSSFHVSYTEIQPPVLIATPL
jgi:hypothetical protein